MKEDVTPGGVKLSFKAEIGGYSVKATDTSFSDGDEIGLTVGYPLSIDNYQMTNWGGTLYGDYELYWEAQKGQPAEFYAYYPYNVAGTHSFRVMDDQTDPADYTASDLMTSYTYSSVSENGNVCLTFRHALSKLWICPVTDDPVQDLYVADVHTSCDWNFSGELTEISLTGEPGMIKASPVGGSFVAIIPPQSAYPRILVVTASGKKYEFVAPFELEFHQGYQTRINMTIQGDEADIDAEIGEWTPDNRTQDEIIAEYYDRFLGQWQYDIRDEEGNVTASYTFTVEPGEHFSSLVMTFPDEYEGYKVRLDWDAETHIASYRPYCLREWTDQTYGLIEDYIFGTIDQNGSYAPVPSERYPVMEISVGNDGVMHFYPLTYSSGQSARQFNGLMGVGMITEGDSQGSMFSYWTLPLPMELRKDGTEPVVEKKGLEFVAGSSFSDDDGNPVYGLSSIFTVPQYDGVFVCNGSYLYNYEIRDYGFVRSTKSPAPVGARNMFATTDDAGHIIVSKAASKGATCVLRYGSTMWELTNSLELPLPSSIRDGIEYDAIGRVRVAGDITGNARVAAFVQSSGYCQYVLDCLVEDGTVLNCRIVDLTGGPVYQPHLGVAIPYDTDFHSPLMAYAYCDPLMCLSYTGDFSSWATIQYNFDGYQPGYNNFSDMDIAELDGHKYLVTAAGNFFSWGGRTPLYIFNIDDKMNPRLVEEFDCQDYTVNSFDPSGQVNNYTDFSNADVALCTHDGQMDIYLVNSAYSTLFKFVYYGE